MSPATTDLADTTHLSSMARKSSRATRRTLPPRLRKSVLVVHVATSVGWLGAVVAYLSLDITAATSSDMPTVQAAYVAMDLILRYAIVPLALTSLLVAIINAIGTTWGLFRHYWVLVKLALTLVAAVVLLLEAPTVAQLAETATAGSDPRDLPTTLAHSAGALLILITNLVLSVFKPRGLTRYGWRKLHQQQLRQAHTAT